MTRRNVKLFCSDIDGTVYGSAESTGRFRSFWESLPERGRPWLCFASGRLIEDQLELLQTAPLPSPDFLIGGVGTCIKDLRQGRILHEYEAGFRDGWNLDTLEQVVAEFPAIERQPERFQTAFKSSWYWQNASAEQVDLLRRRLLEAGLNVSVIYSSSRDLDILPARADKGNALAWLCRHLEVSPEEAVVAGDTGNDLRMFQVAGIAGIVVGNAKPELIEGTRGMACYRAAGVEADGVIEGLRYYGAGK